ncbi:hypothetical protein SprV_0802554900 [Sparganum proliferum]
MQSSQKFAVDEDCVSLRVDARDYSYRNGKCIADVDASDTLKCSIKEGKKDNGDVVEYTYTLQRHNQGHQFEYVFCSTSNSYLSTVIDWENKEYEGDDDIGGSEGGKDKEESGDDGDEEDNGDGGDKEDNEDGKDEEDGQRGDENAGDDDVGGPEDDDIQCRDSRKETSIRDLEKSVFVSEDDGVDLSDFAEVDDE